MINNSNRIRNSIKLKSKRKVKIKIPPNLNKFYNKIFKN